MSTKSSALLVIDPQNDYFPGGAFPLWNADETLSSIVQTIRIAREKGIKIIFVKHVADPAHGLAPFFNEGTEGVKIHQSIIAAAPDAVVVKKHFADSFEKTDLNQILSAHKIDRIMLCGMMTQNCVTHTALSRSSDAYEISILQDCCTTVSEILHKIALHAVSTRVALTNSEDALV